ncbi:MAG: DarT ssDNA thymidine ADP-ribosyltransferase family protein [Dehalococcoidia bacterium]|nr:DarT ssDNA thymidine ADP-ribosyltransferase family protein [Dehalococcoidia bacterium]
MCEPAYIEARPRTEEEIANLPYCTTILDAAERRGVSQVVHFTTTSGVVGILAAKAVKSRKRLPKEEYLEYVYQPNAEIRKDVVWLDYVNLSIERINDWMFDHSERWHAGSGNPWVLLSFHPRILTHPGVVFTTTNNIYPLCRRAEGLDGFLQMFTEPVYGRYGVKHNRANKLASWPTDRQAEVLYPGDLSCTNLQRIYVQLEESLDTVHGILGGLNMDVPVSLAPEVFE